MSSRSNKRRVGNLFYRRFHSAFMSLSAEELEWLNATPVGREFGSPDYEKLMEQDRKEFQSNLSNLIKVCRDLADAKTGDVAPEERQVAVNVQIALQEFGQPVSLEVAAEVWRHHSNSMMAGLLDGWCRDNRIGPEDPVFVLHERQIEVSMGPQVAVFFARLQLIDMEFG
jgi:hypothetical protein